MFSLIITIISIALVVALVAATMYYGGSALNQGTETADAAGLVSGAQQIVAAITLHQSLEGSVPANIDALVSSKYLSSVPATVAGVDWTLDTATRTLTIADPEATLSDAVCNRLSKDGGHAKTINAAGEITEYNDITTVLYGCVKDAASGPNTFTFNY